MTLYLNDLSIAGKFLSSDVVLDSLLGLYTTTRGLSLRLVITKHLLYRLALDEESLYDVIVGAGKTQRGLLLGWLAKSGPFLEEDQLQVDNDLWWCDSTEVTEQGLGEAARRQSLGHYVGSFSSSEGCQGAFDYTPIEILQGFPEEPISTIRFQNVWTTNDLGAFAKTLQAEPASWSEFILECTKRYDLVEIDVENFTHALEKHPFNRVVIRRAFALLDVLNRIAHGLEADGSLSEASMQLITEHFQGKKAWFSDEEPADKSVFWFRDNNNGGQLYCSWHGKIKTPQFRLHFQWPVPVGQRYIKVIYLGEKLTKW